MTNETNNDFVHRLMNYNPHGALVQAFIIEAISRYADQCAKNENRLPEDVIVNPDAWQGVAIHIQAELRKKYG